MKIKIKTEVAGNYRQVMSRFDRNLFVALIPKKVSLQIVRFTGSKKGNRVHVRFLKPWEADWISDITADGENENQAFFVDEGVQLPFGLTYWKHQHIVEKISEERSFIIDDIEYRASSPLLAFLLYPVLYLGFYQRKRPYRAYFK